MVKDLTNRKLGKPLNTPLRTLEGITYWVIEDAEPIRDFILTNVRREWEEDVKHMADDPAHGPWLSRLDEREWKLEIVRTDQLKLDERAMRYVDRQSGYNFAESLANRRRRLRTSIEKYGGVIWPIIVRKEDMQILDGYCRYTTLKEMGIQRLYAYFETLESRKVNG
jgi:hypothetical protein